MKNIVLFDMDGTLTPARQPMERKVTDKLQKLQSANFEIGIVTGSDLEYIKEQCKDLFRHFSLDRFSIHFLPCNGTKYYKFGEKGFYNIYENNIRKELGESNWKRMIRVITSLQLSLITNNKSIPLSGNFINYRGSTLNWCPIGRQATIADRASWTLWDKHKWIRSRWLKNIREEFDASGLSNVVVKMGGDTSFDIYPMGWDKTYALRHFSDRNVWFVGDRARSPKGNDYEIFQACGHRSFHTDGPEQKKEIIKEIQEKIGGSNGFG